MGEVGGCNYDEMEREVPNEDEVCEKVDEREREVSERVAVREASRRERTASST